MKKSLINIVKNILPDSKGLSTLLKTTGQKLNVPHPSTIMWSKGSKWTNIAIKAPPIPPGWIGGFTQEYPGIEDPPTKRKTRLEKILDEL